MSKSNSKQIAWPLQPYTLPAIYIGTLFVAALKATLGTTTKRAELFGNGKNPSANGLDLLEPASMRHHKVCDRIAALRPDLMDRAGFGDVLRLYETQGIVDPTLFDPALVEIVTHSLSDRLMDPKRQAARRMARVAELIDLTPVLDPKLKTKKFELYELQESDLNPIPPRTLEQTLAQELILQDPKQANQWVQLNYQSRIKKVLTEAEKLILCTNEEKGELWTSCAKGLASKLPAAENASPSETLDAYCSRPADETLITSLQLRAKYLIKAR